MPGHGRVGVACVRRLFRDTVLLLGSVGIVVGVLWWLLHPEVTYVVYGGVAHPEAPERGDTFALDGILTLLCLAAGLLTGALLWQRHHGRALATLLALVVGGVAASVLAVVVGGVLGPDPLDERAAQAENGAELVTDVALSSPAVLLVWSIAAVLAVLGILAVTPSEPRSGQPSPSSVE